MKLSKTIGLGLLLAWSSASLAADDAVSLYIISPENGATVTSPVKVQFGLSGMGVAPAGVDTPNTGHHHLLVDADTLPEAGLPMGKDVMHFGGGQTETLLELAPGEHTLQLVLGDKNHVPLSPMVTSEKISITVK